MYIIFVTPANKNWNPHVWEGGVFETVEKAKPFLKQLKALRQDFDKRKKFFSKVEIRAYKK